MSTTIKLSQPGQNVAPNGNAKTEGQCKEYTIRFYYKKDEPLNILSASFIAESPDAAEQRGRMLAVSFGAFSIAVKSKSPESVYIDCPPTIHGLSVIDRALKEGGQADGIGMGKVKLAEPWPISKESWRMLDKKD